MDFTLCNFLKHLIAFICFDKEIIYICYRNKTITLIKNQTYGKKPAKKAAKKVAKKATKKVAAKKPSAKRKGAKRNT